MKRCDSAYLLVFLLMAVFNCHAVFAKDSLIQSLDPKYWNCSEWISVKDAPVISGTISWSQRAADGANWFISDVVNEKEVLNARWMTTALGVYDIFVNGELIGDEILKPGFSHFDKTKYSYTYDITAYYDKAEGAKNQLSAQVTPGWWADRIITPNGNKGTVGKKCAFRGVLEVTFVDGTVKSYGTNLSDWKAAIAGKVKHAAIYDGEIFDDREKHGFECCELMSEPEINKEFIGDILPSDGAEIYLRMDLMLTPKLMYVYQGIDKASEVEYGKIVVDRSYNVDEIVSLKSGETLVVDFGQNCSALPCFKFKAREGTTLRCLPGEILNDGNGAKSRGMDGPEGSVHRKNLRIPDDGMYVEYTFGQRDSFVEYMPRYTYFGYRYLSVTADDEVEISAIRSIPVSSVTPEMEKGKINTGNSDINQLINNTIWSMRSNYLSIPTDCPNRNERLGWLADAQIFCETASFFADTENFFRKWLRDVRDSQFESGAYPTVAPVGWQGENAMCCGWSDAGVIVPFVIFKQYGDTDIIRRQWDSMVKYMDHIYETKYEYDLLTDENMKYVYADWLSYEPLGTYSKDYLGKDGEILPEAKEYWNYLSQSYWLMDAVMMRIMGGAIGDEDACRKYENLENDLRNCIRNRYFSTDGRFKIQILDTMQTPALFALVNKILDPLAERDLIDRLRENFTLKGSRLSTGFLGTSILMNTLSENGMSDISYDLLFQHDNPSWLYSIDNGATTIWERWDSYTIENGLAPSGMNSFNHYAYGAVCEWIWKTVAGIAADLSCPGFKHIILKPIPDTRLGFIDAEFLSPAGMILSSWRYEGDKWNWEFTIPEGSSASVTLPGSNESKEYLSGSYRISLQVSDGLTDIKWREPLKRNVDGLFEIDKSENESVHIFNMQGINVYSTKEKYVDLRSLPKGPYIIKISERCWKIIM